MKIRIVTCQKSQKEKSDLLCLYQYENENIPLRNKELTKQLQTYLSTSIKNYKFTGKKNKLLLINGKENFQRILVIGLGEKNDVNAESIRLATYKLIREASSLKSTKVTIIPEEKFIKQIAEGIRFASYHFKGLFQKNDPDKEMKVKQVLIATSEKKDSSLLAESKIVFKAVDLARDLVNLPSNIVTPLYLEKEAKKIASNPNVTLKTINLKQAEKLKMGAFAAVARGSKEPARMIILEYKGAPKSKDKIGIVGKAITFDSGGISLKPPKNMGEMKTDMGGGAAALATFKAVSELGLKINLIVIIPATENMPGGNAYKPGDILTASNGKTIEVVSTDAEGRLVMADALVHIQKLGANKLIDIATLTGACLVTFGHIHTGLMTNNSNWKDKLLSAANLTGEKFWELPMNEEYGELIKSDICDMVNAVESRDAGTITAGKLLEQFVEKSSRWIHLDIAGTSYHSKNQKYYGKYATGAPTRTLIELVKGEVNK